MVDIDLYPNLAMQNSVEAVPTVKLFVKGQAKDGTNSYLKYHFRIHGTSEGRSYQRNVRKSESQ